MLKYEATQEMTIKYLEWKINKKKQELRLLQDETK